MNNNDGPELIGLGRAGRVMRFGNIAVKTANIWTVPEDASETTVIGWEQMIELNRVPETGGTCILPSWACPRRNKALSGLRHRDSNAISTPRVTQRLSARS